MDELKPCPFCGGKPFFVQSVYKSKKGDYVKIACSNCNADQGIYRKRHLAIMWWNGRTDNANQP